MIAATHPVTPEEVMAFLDGELAPEQAQCVSEHVEQCKECTAVAAEFRAMSQTFSASTGKPVPEKLQKRVEEMARKIATGVDVGYANLFVRLSFWSWKKWAVAAGATAMGVLLIAAIAIPNLMRARMSGNESSAAGSLRALNFAAVDYAAKYGRYPSSLRDLGPGTNGSISEHGAGEVDPALASGQKEGYVFSYRSLPNNGYAISADPVVPKSSGHHHFSTDQTGVIRADGQPLDGDSAATYMASHRAAAPQSNGLLQGPGDRIEKSLSVDGQLRAEQKSEALNSAIAGPMIARTVSLSLVVKDFAAARANLDAILRRHHGYAADLTANTAENAPRSLEASLRVPAAELDAALADLKSLGKVEREAQSGEEVTQQHADLVARLKNSRETEMRLQEILLQRTGKIKDVLEVEQEIARVRGEIEQMEAEQKSLEHRVEFATVNLTLNEEYKEKLVSPAISAGTRLHNALVEGYREASETVLGIVLFFVEYTLTLLIWGLILVVPAILLWRRYRRTLATLWSAGAQLPL